MSSIFHNRHTSGPGTPDSNGPKTFFQKLHKAFHPYRRPSISFSHAEDTWADSKRRRLSIISTSENKVGSRPLLALATGSFWQHVSDTAKSADSLKFQSPYPQGQHDRRRVAQEDGAFSLEHSRNTSKSDGRGNNGAQPDSRSSSTTDPFSPPELLSLSDSIRSSLYDTGTLGPEADKLISFLDWALSAETTPPHHPGHDHRIEFRTIQHAHLDKLVGEITATGRRMQRSSLSPRWITTIDLAESLQRAWRARFKARYFMIDEQRTTQLVTKGGLHGVCWSNPFLSPTTSPNSAVSRLTKPQAPKLQLEKETAKSTGQLEGDDAFQAGDWWLTMACARRDGMVGTEEEKVSKGRYNVSTLPLLSGREEQVGKRNGNATKYIRTGTLKDMHVELLSLVGKQVRVLRGYLLRSGMAPTTGVRFDGIWKLASYRHRLDVKSGEYKLELSLERMAGQKPMGEVLKVPRPSQMDEWALFEKLEADKVRQVEGEAAAYAWRCRREEGRREREEWRRLERFRGSVSGVSGSGREEKRARKKSEVMNMPVVRMIEAGKVKERADEARSERKRVRLGVEGGRGVVDVTSVELRETEGGSSPTRIS